MEQNRDENNKQHFKTRVEDKQRVGQQIYSEGRRENERSRESRWEEPRREDDRRTGAWKEEPRREEPRKKEAGGEGKIHSDILHWNQLHTSTPQSSPRRPMAQQVRRKNHNDYCNVTFDHVSGCSLDLSH